MVSKLSEICSGLFIPDPDAKFFPIPDPGVKKGTGSRVRNTDQNRKKYLILPLYVRWMIGGGALTGG
jgi:hypothetical protein